jgi:regulator of PEP synthase PpsR (kinase-PPPase family)
MSEDKHIFIVSDATGETAEKMVQAGLLQFSEERALVTRYGRIRTETQIREILTEAAQNRALVIYTLVSDTLRCFVEKETARIQVDSVDLLGSMILKLRSFLHREPTQKPGLLHQMNKLYFSRIEAIEYTVRHDDGQSPNELDQAEIVIVGVSRVSKTPLSIYLAQEGWRVANLPIVIGMGLPEKLFQIPQDRIIGLTIQPHRLVEIRRSRLQRLGIKDSSYTASDSVQRELRYALEIFQNHPSWKVIDVTGKSIEETASEILDRLFGKERRLSHTRP